MVSDQPGQGSPVTPDEILDFLDEELGIDTGDIEEDTLLFSSGIVDSFALVTLITFLENRGGFRMNPADVNLDNLDSVARICAYAERAGA